MLIVLTVFLVIFSVFLHELGHAAYMQKYGVPVQTLSVGLPFPIALRFRSKRFLDGALIQFTPLLLGAYVKPTDKGDEIIRRLSCKKQADIFGAGPLANFCFSLSLLLAVEIYANLSNLTIYLSGYRFLTLAVLLGFLLLWPRLFSRYLMIPVGVLTMCLTVWMLFHDPLNSVVGPVGIGKIISNVFDVKTAILISCVLSLSIGLFNVIPLMPLDAGHVVRALLGSYPRLQRMYSIFSISIFFVFIAFALISDFLK